jgi:hypothetical protein
MVDNFLLRRIESCAWLGTRLRRSGSWLLECRRHDPRPAADFNPTRSTGCNVAEMNPKQGLKTSLRLWQTERAAAHAPAFFFSPEQLNNNMLYK